MRRGQGRPGRAGCCQRAACRAASWRLLGPCCRPRRLPCLQPLPQLRLLLQRQLELRLEPGHLTRVPLPLLAPHLLHMPPHPSLYVDPIDPLARRLLLAAAFPVRLRPRCRLLLLLLLLLRGAAAGCPGLLQLLLQAPGLVLGLRAFLPQPMHLIQQRPPLLTHRLQLSLHAQAGAGGRGGSRPAVGASTQEQQQERWNRQYKEPGQRCKRAATHLPPEETLHGLRQRPQRGAARSSSGLPAWRVPLRTRRWPGCGPASGCSSAAAPAPPAVPPPPPATAGRARQWRWHGGGCWGAGLGPERAREAGARGTEVTSTHTYTHTHTHTHTGMYTPAPHTCTTHTYAPHAHLGPLLDLLR